MTTVEVFYDHGDRQQLAGQAHFTRDRRGSVSTTFIYDPAYLTRGGLNLDPALLPTTGAQHLPRLLGAFADSAPDRWGRNLLDKAERMAAIQNNRAARRLDDVDYLLGVSDDTRQGALRFRPQGRGDFVSPPSKVPKLVSLPQLLSLSEEVTKDDDSSRAVKQLLETGTTGLGGARPKASVRLDDGALAIARFPHSSDGWDVMAWEATALDLMDSIGLSTPKRRLIRVAEANVLVLSRFNREAIGSDTSVP